MAYIQVLKRDLGQEEPLLDKNLSVDEASSLISDLKGKAKHQGNGCKLRHIIKIKINEPRLGMAMKECFRRWRQLGKDVYGTKRELFKDEVIKTYYMFTEIAEALGQSQKRAPVEE